MICNDMSELFDTFDDKAPPNDKQLNLIQLIQFFGISLDEVGA